MRLSVIASTKPGYSLRRKDALLFSGHEAGICYMADNFEAIKNEKRSKTLGRIRGTVGSGHHSVAGHVSYCLLLVGIPKILAMLINNEKDCNVSEKSARYTKMRTKALEKKIYEKWIKIFKDLIAKKYADLDDKTVTKLAQENARYFISVFTPATTMGYTVDLRQANYLIGWCDKMIAESEGTDDPFMIQLRPWVIKLSTMLKKRLNVDGLRDGKGREFTLFAKRPREEEVGGEMYCVNYYGTFSQLAQAQRHRTLHYEMTIPNLDTCEFYIPPIIEDPAIREEYLADMEKLKDNFPQGMLIKINERGAVEDFELKCHERRCGAAQREICIQTGKTLNKLVDGAQKKKNTAVYEELSWYVGKTKCQMGHECNRPCPLGAKHAFDRLI